MDEKRELVMNCKVESSYSMIYKKWRDQMSSNSRRKDKKFNKILEKYFIGIEIPDEYTQDSDFLSDIPTPDQLLPIHQTDNEGVDEYKPNDSPPFNELAQSYHSSQMQLILNSRVMSGSNSDSNDDDDTPEEEEEEDKDIEIIPQVSFDSAKSNNRKQESKKKDDEEYEPQQTSKPQNNNDWGGDSDVFDDNGNFGDTPDSDQTDTQPTSDFKENQNINLPGEDLYAVKTAFISSSDFDTVKKDLQLSIQKLSNELNIQEPFEVCSEANCLESAVPGFSYCIRHIGYDKNFANQSLMKRCQAMIDGHQCCCPVFTHDNFCQSHQYLFLHDS